MTSELPKHNSLWVYRGPGEGQGEIHQVIACDVSGVMTWGREKNTWSGAPDLFYDHFSPMEEPHE